MAETTKQYAVEDQSKNGVRVIVTRWKSGGTTVDATCQCFGSDFRCHSNPSCPNLHRQENA